MIPDKCINCDHTIMALENVHKGWCKFQIEEVVRCDCAPYHPIVGCCDAEVTCQKKIDEWRAKHDSQRTNRN